MSHDIAAEIRRLHSELPEGVRLVAVSKFHPAEAIREAYDAGQRLFGESRVNELLEKEAVLPSDINWHFIGHLQTNKVRRLMGKVSMIESVDTERLLELIDSESRRAGVLTRVLMQVHVAQEETKFGFSPEEVIDYFSRHAFCTLTNTHICGVMGMASNTDDMERVRADFSAIADVFTRVRQICGDELLGFDVISMGMSGDWPIAVAEGSNLVRVGTAIFGERQYI
ncbi:MAG: YggS family pyridoxal phosphate-dependent enzyme [Muribaculaceae bacterium]|nr:YggS family pyridoxal phosphate-dependent enzyme [Bacteroides sp.]MDE6681504.1 YggS family pyridoxal phosphate-dependent enzyme [Muribaculaceae bacterium]MDE7188586.1 YggS family pyridoxal phosphate-dependent enzyme [Muribaculaceae bacterium]